MPGSPPSRITEPATNPPPRTRSSSPIPLTARDSVSCVISVTVRLAALPAGALRAAGSDKAEAASSSVFHAWQAGHCPCHCGVRAPHAPHTYVGFVFAMGPLPARSNARGLAMLARSRHWPGYVKSPAIRMPSALLYSALRCPP